MEIATLEKRLASLTYTRLTSPAAGRVLYDMSLKDGVDNVLELGFAHGTSTAYIAAALDEKGAGQVTTIDRADALDRSPNINDLLAHVGLTHLVRPIFAANSYTWELMRLLEANQEGAAIAPVFDLCFIDGAHTWDADGLAFCLADQLLNDDRWIVFDDVNWTFGSSQALKDSQRVREMPAEERDTPQVRKVIECLVRARGYDVRFLGNYAFTYKPSAASAAHRGDISALFASDSRLMQTILAAVKVRHGDGDALTSAAT